MKCYLRTENGGFLLILYIATHYIGLVILFH